MWSDEAFPNSERLFHEAFSQPKPASELLKLIAEHPTYDAVRDMLAEYTSMVEETPSRVEVLTSALVAVRDSPDAPKINNMSLSKIYGHQLPDLHSHGLDLDDDNKTLGPANTYLSNSLLAGLSFKLRLMSRSDQYGAILESLDTRADAPGAEVLVTGACIRLLTAGLEIMKSCESFFKSANVVAIKLRAQKAAGTVQNPNALRLLELAISHAERWFKKENDIDNIWKILFPTQA